MSYEAKYLPTQIDLVEQISYTIDVLRCEWDMDIEDIVNNMDIDVYNKLKACIRERIEIEGPGPIYK
jgi:hypothetical protein